MRSLTINGKTITDDGDAYVIAEIGHNHMGNLEECKRLFRAAADCGVDAVKLQKRDNKTLFTRAFYDSPYENENSYGATYGEHREALEFGWEEYIQLRRLADELHLTFFATPFDIPSADFLHRFDMPAYKMGSGDLTNTPLLRHVAGFHRPMLLSTGGATIEDVERAIAECFWGMADGLAILQCTSSYPTRPEDMNLGIIETYRRQWPNLIIGLSDHQNGIAMALVGYMLGARIIEKHLTLNRANKGTDHPFSLEPIGLKKLVRDLRRARVAIGDGVKRPLECERSALHKMRKSLVAARPIAKGQVITADDIAAKSPAGGLPPYRIDELIGTEATRDYREDEKLELGGE